jgi:ankyrin repeat protein
VQRTRQDCQTLEKGAYIEARVDYGRTALHLAAATGQTQIVQLLLAENVDANVKARDGRTALYLAARSGYEGVVRQLINFGANKDSCDNDKSTALHCAASNGHGAIMRLLLQELRSSKEASEKTRDNAAALRGLEWRRGGRPIPAG